MTKIEKAREAYLSMMLAANALMDSQCISQEHRDRVQSALDKVEEELENNE